MNRVLTIAHSRKPLWGPVIFGMMVCALITMGTIPSVHALPNHWVLNSGDHLEVLRDFICFNAGKAGARSTTKTVTFDYNVQSAEVFLSGFNMWYTGKNDHEVSQERVDAWVISIGGCNDITGCHPKDVNLQFLYVMRDEDTTQSDDVNRACIGFNVLAQTR